MTSMGGESVPLERAGVAETPRAPAAQLPGLLARSVAVVIDLVLYLGVGWVLAAVLFAVVCAVSWAATGAGDYPPALGAARLWLWVLFPCAYVLFAATQEVLVLGRQGTTIGKSRAGLRVESCTQEPLTSRRLLLRFLLGPKGPIAPISVVYYLIRGAGLHDRVAGSRVVNAAPEAAVVTGKLAYLPGILSAMGAAMILMGLPMLFRFRALLAELGSPPTAIALTAAEVQWWAFLWAPAGALAIALVWLPPRTRLEISASWWISVGLLILGIVGLMTLVPVGLLSMMSLYQTLSGP
jgi:hypothetical protein